jgi:CRISPR-associated protein Csd2
MLHTESSQLDLTSRYDFVLLFDVVDGNPNGDPDAGNMPRLDPETMQGLVTDGAIKRKVRDFITLRHQDPDGTPKEGMDIFVKHGGVLNTEIESAYRKIGIAPRPKGEAKTTTTQRTTARDMMCEMYWDVRTFGAVMSTGMNAGQVRGPVQIGFARSIDSIVPLEVSITRVAFTQQKAHQK